MENKMNTIGIKGKQYVLVNERLKYFRKNFPGYSLESEIVSLTDTRVVIKATIRNQDGRVVANGHTFEEQNSSMINKTSFIENGETSAWGRALANLGIGIDDAVASADEVEAAVSQQERMNAKKQAVNDAIDMVESKEDVKQKEQPLQKPSDSKSVVPEWQRKGTYAYALRFMLNADNEAFLTVMGMNIANNPEWKTEITKEQLENLRKMMAHKKMFFKTFSEKNMGKVDFQNILNAHINDMWGCYGSQQVDLNHQPSYAKLMEHWVSLGNIVPECFTEEVIESLTWELK